MVQTVSVVGSVVTNSGWIGPASIAVALLVGLLSVAIAFLLWRAYRKTNNLQKELIQLTREQHDWLVRQRQPELLTAAVYVTRYVDTPNVKRYPGHSGSSGPHTGFKTTLVLNNPGEAHLHVLRLLVRLEGDLYTGWNQRKFKPESRFRHGEFLPHALKELYLFAKDDAARNEKIWPSIAVEIEYVSGSQGRILFLDCKAPIEESVGEPVPLHFTQHTVQRQTGDEIQ